MLVNIKETTTIKPAKETPITNLWVSDLDLIVPNSYVPTVYYYKKLQDPNNTKKFFEADVLKNALSEVLVPFYPTAGTLGTDDNGRTNINCNANGALFVEAETTCVLADLGDSTPSSETELLVPNLDSFLDISSKPLFAAQLTCFKCGSVSLGLMFHHVVVDGISAIHFINSWSDVARGKSISIPPLIDRTLVDARDPPTPTFHHIEYDPPPTKLNPSINTAPTCATVLKITPDHLTILKSKFNNNDIGVTFTSYEILAAHIWYCMCKSRGLPDDQAIKLFVPTDGRSRLVPPLPQEYFGNVQFTTAVVSSVREIQSRPLDQTMLKIHQALKERDDEYLRSALDYIRKQPDPTVLRRGAHAFKCPNTNVVSWAKLPLYEADFGWGRPFHVGRVKIGYEGAVYILPSPNPNDRTLFLSVFLPTDHIDSFQKFFYDF